jgi:two-component system response regulator HydG
VKKALEKLQLSRDNVELRRQLEEKFGFEGIIGNTEKMHRIFDILKQVAPTDVTVLIQGESGTGKELIARAIHQNSRRRHHRFVALNCAALSEGILESELFGHEKGAFTGALYQRKGRFEFAHKGTLFLDEIGDMPLSTQIKLLRVIEEREIYRVGSNVPIPVDVRLIAATNQNLDELVKEGKFREDLYYRLKVVTINLPPLRERLADIPLLISHFIKEFNARHGKNVQSMSPRARDLLFLYPWPGNIRELRNCIESMVVTCKGRELTVDDIPAYISPDKVPESPIPMLAGISLEKAEKELIKNTLAMVNGNREEAARILGIGERTLYRKLKRYNLA